MELTRQLANGLVIVRRAKGERTMYSSRRACPECGFSVEELAPRMFSFNNPFGACPECLGIGATLHADPERIVPNKDKPIGKAISVWGLTPTTGALVRFSETFEYDPRRPIRELSEKGWKALMYGSDQKMGLTGSGPGEWWGSGWLREGLVAAVERRWRQTKSEGAKEYYLGFLSFIPCRACGGKRLKPESLAVKVQKRSIADVSSMTVTDAVRFFHDLRLSDRDEQIVGQVVKEIRARLGFLENVGLTYLTLDRGSGTLSGGEAERIALATQIGSGLVGVPDILDEPSIGLHARDHQRLLATLKTLRDLGNTVLVVEHDEMTMRESDWLVDLGPGAGVHGGEILYSGSPGEDRGHSPLPDGGIPLGPPVDRVALGPGATDESVADGARTASSTT